MLYTWRKGRKVKIKWQQPTGCYPISPENEDPVLKRIQELNTKIQIIELNYFNAQTKECAPLLDEMYECLAESSLNKADLKEFFGNRIVTKNPELTSREVRKYIGYELKKVLDIRERSRKEGHFNG